jgi:hypothetical protein
MPSHALVLFFLALAACDTPPPEPAPIEAPPSKAPVRARGGKKAPEEPKAPPDPDLGSIPAKGGELIGCPPESRYTQVDLPEGGAEIWCDKNGVKHGAYLTLWKDGSQHEKGAYLNGQKDGPWNTWYEVNESPTAEAKESRGTWDHDREIGSWNWWYPNGKLKEEGDFLNGRRAGQWTEYATDGRKAAEGLYVNGEKDGAWTFYKPGSDGVVDHVEKYSRGQRVDKPPSP